MPEYNGAAQIGFLLGGGAKQMKAQAFDEGRLNTAKTEEALASARMKQLEATEKATAAREADAIERKIIDNGGSASEAALIGSLIRSKGGSDYYSAQQGIDVEQSRGFRRTAADPATGAEERTRALGALHKQPYPDIVGVSGTGGYTDITADEPTVTIPPGGGGERSTAVKNYEYAQGLSPEERAAFSPFVRSDQVINAGGVPYTNPVVGTGPRQPRPAVDPAQAADNAAAIAAAKKTGTTIAVQKADYPMVKFTLDQNKLNIQATSQIIDELLADPKLWQAQGLTRLVSEVPGTEGAYIKSKLDVLGNKQMLQTLINLRAMSKTGGAVGNVSDREGATMRSAQAAIADQNISMGDLLLELRRLRAYNDQFQMNMDSAFNATYDKDGNPVLSTAPRGTPQGEDAGPSIEDEIINRGDGEYDDNGNLVRADGWIFMKDAGGNAAWVSPDGTDYEEVAQ